MLRLASPRGGRSLAAATAVALALGSVAACGGTAQPPRRVDPALAAGATPGVAGPVPAEPSPAAPDVPVADPSTVRMPRLDIDASLDALTLDESGRLVPPEFGRAGWYRAGPEPGEPGPSVIAGHIDSWTGPDVFYRLSSARAGDEILVDRVDGSTATFRVTAVERYPKDEFPTDQVYGDTSDPQLRLITCGGEFDRSARSYLDNVIVYAELAR